MRKQLTRRDALKVAAGTGFAMAMGAHAAAQNTVASYKADGTVKLGIIGAGSRGTALLERVLDQDAAAVVPAICDIDEAAAKHACDLVEKARGKRPEAYVKGPDDFRRLLARDDINSVIIATPHDDHARMAIDAMKAGKFVGAEVPSCCTVDECWDLAKTHQQTHAGYMLLENYNFTDSIMQVLNMAQKGLFGELTYAYGTYIHNVASLRFKADGTMTWRGENVAKHPGNIYPTHALGPIAWWLGLDGDNDRMISLVAMQSKSIARHEAAAKQFGPDSPAAKVVFENGDTSQTLIKTAKGRLIELRYDTASNRPPGGGQYSLQGTKGAYEAVVGQQLVYLDGKSPEEKWEPLANYQGEFEHPRWKERRSDATKAGHGGSDWLVIDDFLNAVRTGKSTIGIYDALAWTVVRPLSEISIQSGSKPVEIPDFRKPKAS